MASTDAHRLARPTEVSEYFGVPVKTLYAWHRAGKGPKAIRVGKHLRYFWADVVAWAEAQPAGPSE
jgi:predicted DNA-binding transcriptional regulator AlpA